MKTSTQLILSVVTAAASATAVVLFLRDDRPVPVVDAAPAHGELDARLAKIDARQSELAVALEALRRDVDMLPSSERASADSIAELVERHLASRDASASPSAPTAAVVDDALGGEAAGAFDLDAALAEIGAVGTDYERSQALWNAIAKAGKLDAALAALEARAEGDPKDPALRVDLGKAYLQKLFHVNNGPEQGTWAVKADQAFDQALELDDRHWEARFQKAVSLSFWPPLFGKQTEAIRNFEVLVEQQASAPKQKEFAETYLWLGNLYQQSGQNDKALSIWQQGAGLYPDHGELAAKLAH